MTDNKKGYLVIEEAQPVLHRLQPIGVTGFLFISIPIEYDPQDASTAAYGRKILHPRHLTTQLVSDTNAWTFSEHFLSQVAKYDLNYRTGLPDSLEGQIHLWRQTEVDSPKRQKLIELMNKHQFKSRLSFFNRVYNHDNWRALILLYSRFSEEEVENRLLQHGESLVTELTMVTDHLYRKYAKTINPFSNYRVLSPQCIQVLEHLSNGMQTADIAEQMAISEAGVNYHINKARNLLGGNNRTHLISQAHRLGII